MYSVTLNEDLEAVKKIKTEKANQTEPNFSREPGNDSHFYVKSFKFNFILVGVVVILGDVAFIVLFVPNYIRRQ
jgi:hypothetical protein